MLEGDADVLEGRRLLLESNGKLVIVYEQSNAALAIGEIADQLVDLILIDIRLQGMNGVEVAKRIAHRFIETDQVAPKMILTTPYEHAQLTEEANLAGITAVVSVADGPTALIEAVEKALAL